VTNTVNPADGVAADDRLEGEFEGNEIPEHVNGLERRALSVFGGKPTAAALEAMWAERDAIYAAREVALTRKEIRDIQQFRTLEVRSLHPREQVNSGLAIRAMTWQPPR
jgi:hypothetical protein